MNTIPSWIAAAIINLVLLVAILSLWYSAVEQPAYIPPGSPVDRQELTATSTSTLEIPVDLPEGVYNVRIYME